MARISPFRRDRGSSREGRRARRPGRRVRAGSSAAGRQFICAAAHLLGAEPGTRSIIEPVLCLCRGNAGNEVVMGFDSVHHVSGGLGLRSDQDELLAEIVRRLIVTYEPLRIYLFGSRARGDAGPDSDFDIMVIVPDDALPERRDSDLAYDVLWSLKEAGDVLVWTESRFQETIHLRSSLPGTVLREGIVLHAA